MKNFKNVIGGRKAKARGTFLETMVKSQGERSGWYVVRIEDGMKRTGPTCYYPVAQVFDFFAVKSGIALFFDTKSLDDNKFQFDRLNQNQVAALLRIEKEGFMAGYLVYFQAIDQVLFFNASILANLKSGQSLKPYDGILIGSILSFDLGKIFELV